MQTINDAFINAILADAVYVDDIVNENVAKLTDGLTERMGPELAKFIAENFKVISQDIQADIHL